MAFDPQNFSRFPVVDTCAVWHTLSSQTLYRSAVAQGCKHVVTNFVIYELLHKPRASPDHHQLELKSRLLHSQQNGDFQSHALSLSDLSEVASIMNRKSLGLGEISSICLARKVGIAFQSDDRHAKTLASSVLGTARVQTTCYLLGWLVFRSVISDGQVAEIIEQHESVGGKLREWLNKLNMQGLHFRLMNSKTGQP